MPEIGSEGDDFAVIDLLEPFENDRGVETAGVGEDAFFNFAGVAGQGEAASIGGGGGGETKSATWGEGGAGEGGALRAQSCCVERGGKGRGSGCMRGERNMVGCVHEKGDKNRRWGDGDGRSICRNIHRWHLIGVTRRKQLGIWG